MLRAREQDPGYHDGDYDGSCQECRWDRAHDRDSICCPAARMKTAQVSVGEVCPRISRNKYTKYPLSQTIPRTSNTSARSPGGPVNATRITAEVEVAS